MEIYGHFLIHTNQSCQFKRNSFEWNIAMCTLHKKIACFCGLSHVIQWICVHIDCFYLGCCNLMRSAHINITVYKQTDQVVNAKLCVILTTFLIEIYAFFGLIFRVFFSIFHSIFWLHQSVLLRTDVLSVMIVNLCEK